MEWTELGEECHKEEGILGPWRSMCSCRVALGLEPLEMDTFLPRGSGSGQHLERDMFLPCGSGSGQHLAGFGVGLAHSLGGWGVPVRGAGSFWGALGGAGKIHLSLPWACLRKCPEQSEEAEMSPGDPFLKAPVRADVWATRSLGVFCSVSLDSPSPHFLTCLVVTAATGGGSPLRQFPSVLYDSLQQTHLTMGPSSAGACLEFRMEIPSTLTRA